MADMSGGPVEYFEARIEFETEKSYLIEMTLGGRYWLPKSQTVAMSEPDIDGNREFMVKAWWMNKKTEAD